MMGERWRASEEMNKKLGEMHEVRILSENKPVNR